MSKKNRKGKSSTSPTPLTIKIFRAFEAEKPGTPFTWKKIIKKFSKKYSKDQVVDGLTKLLEQGRLDQWKDNRLVISQTQGNKKAAKKVGGPAGSLTGKQYQGVVDMNAAGDAYVVCDDLEGDVFVSQYNLMMATDGDVVKVSIIRKRKNGRKEGEVVEIVKRKRDQFIGTVLMNKDFAFLKTDHFIPFDLYISSKHLNGVKNGQKAIARVLEWPTKEGDSPRGEIIDVLSGANLTDIEMKSILIESGFNLEFPEEVMKESEAIKEEITAEEVGKREDMRDVLTFTIDPDNAKDFDDALSFQVLENGNYEIGVHIADVSHYVTPGTALDEEAQERTTSVYLVDRVLPMLPEKISNKVCSLRPNEEKLTFSSIFEMDDKAKVVNVRFGKTVIESDKRFTYDEAQEIIEGKKDETFSTPILIVDKLAKILRAQRYKEGSIAFNSQEVKFKLDETGKPIGITIKVMKDANQLIEDFMLLANRYVAKYLSKLKHGKQPLPSVYRIHDTPDMEKLQVFADFARKFGHVVKFTDPEQIADVLNNLMGKINGKPEQAVLEQLAIRSMAKAIYTTDNIGHYGLGFEFYTHFTSPIRRYPDVLVHRILHESQINDKELYHKAVLEDLLKHSSNMERSAMKAERESTKYKQVEYMSDKIGEEFDGVITGVIARGIFVEISEAKCEGMINVRDLNMYDAVFNDAELSIEDPITETKFQMGEPIRVKVIATDLDRRTIDLGLAEEVNKPKEEKPKKSRKKKA